MNSNKSTCKYTLFIFELNLNWKFFFLTISYTGNSISVTSKHNCKKRVWGLAYSCRPMGHHTPQLADNGSKQQCVLNNSQLDGILGGYSLHILQPPLGGGVFRVSSDLNSGKKVRVFHLGGGGVLGKLRSELRK